MTDLTTKKTYIGKDRDTIRDELLRILQVEYPDLYNDVSASSVGQMLVDLFASVGESLAYYTDRQFDAQFLDTVDLLRDAERLSRNVGYKPGPAASASVDVILQCKTDPAPLHGTIYPR